MFHSRTVGKSVASYCLVHTSPESIELIITKTEKSAYNRARIASRASEILAHATSCVFASRALLTRAGCRIAVTEGPRSAQHALNSALKNTYSRLIVAPNG